MNCLPHHQACARRIKSFNLLALERYNQAKAIERGGGQSVLTAATGVQGGEAVLKKHSVRGASSFLDCHPETRKQIKNRCPWSRSVKQGKRLRHLGVHGIDRVYPISNRESKENVCRRIQVEVRCMFYP